jgi:hypothetical protein
VLTDRAVSFSKKEIAYEKKSELALVKGVKPKSLPLRLASRWGRPKLK